MERAAGVRPTGRGDEEWRAGRALRYGLRKARERRRRALPVEDDPTPLYIVPVEVGGPSVSAGAAESSAAGAMIHSAGRRRTRGALGLLWRDDARA